MDSLGIARWQFGITTVYHFLFVPITIGMAFFIAITETAWVRTRNPVYLRAVKFWGKIFLINFAIGVVTGIVQEFQFGMNWSSYSRFVGDVFGAPLAMEALLAFFLESTFLGLWIFGWDKLSPRLHLACIWLVSIGTMLSAFFIMAANSFMQHPVGITVNPERDRAEMNDIWAVLTQPLNVYAYSHVIAGAVLSGAAMFAGISSYFLMKRKHVDVFRPAVRFGLFGLLIGSILTIISGDLLAKVMTDVQPMKMAAAEALFETSAPASFSIFTIGSLDGSTEVFSIRVPGVLSFMATESFTGEVEGINNVQARFEEMYGPGDYRPEHPGDLLDVPADDGRGRRDAAGLDRRVVADQKGPTTQVQMGVDIGHGINRRAGCRAFRGLDLHRNGPPALDGGRPLSHRGLGVPLGVRWGCVDLPDRLHVALRHAGRHRDRSDDQVGQDRPAQRGRGAGLDPAGSAQAWRPRRWRSG